jgi:uncharacterized protein (DUF305 family)
MTKSNTLLRFAAVAVAATLFSSMALAQPTGSPAAMPPSGAMTHSPGGMDMKSMMKENGDKMQSMQMSGDPDVDFAQMMRMHHQGAIDMAEMELKNGKDSRMKSMAKSIIAAQKKEIAQFDKFLSQHQGGK